MGHGNRRPGEPRRDPVDPALHRRCRSRSRSSIRSRRPGPGRRRRTAGRTRPAGRSRNPTGRTPGTAVGRCDRCRGGHLQPGGPDPADQFGQDHLELAVHRHDDQPGPNLPSGTVTSPVSIDRAPGCSRTAGRPSVERGQSRGPVGPGSSRRHRAGTGPWPSGPSYHSARSPCVGHDLELLVTVSQFAFAIGRLGLVERLPGTPGHPQRTHRADHLRTEQLAPMP